MFRVPWGYSFPEPAALVFPNLGRVSKAAGGVFFSSRHASTSEERHLSCGVMFLGVIMGGGGRWHLLFGHCRWIRVSKTTEQRKTEHYAVMSIMGRVGNPGGHELTCCSDREWSLTPCRHLQLSTARGPASSATAPRSLTPSYHLIISWSLYKQSTGTSEWLPDHHGPEYRCYWISSARAGEWATKGVSCGVFFLHGKCGNCVYYRGISWWKGRPKHLLKSRIHNHVRGSLVTRMAVGLQEKGPGMALFCGQGRRL